MRQRTFRSRAKSLFAAESSEPERWMYLSFATDEDFKGAVVTYAHGLLHALHNCKMRNINPGGEVLGVNMPPHIVPPEQYRERLLSKDDVTSLWSDAKSLREFEDENE